MPSTSERVVRIRKMQLKIVLVGERRVGKTSLLERYLKNHFPEEYTGTLGGRVYPTDLEVGLDGDDIALTHVAFFDLMGEHSVRKVFAEPFFYGTQGVLAVCDVERPETLHLIKDWMDVVTKIAGPIPTGIAFNKVDRAESMAIGPEETAWVRKEFPLVPTFMTSARTGQGVEEAFSTIVSRVVDSVLASGKKTQSGRLLRQRILLFIAGRDQGASKNELFADFRQVPPGEIMAELDHLVHLDAVALDEAGPKTFVKAADVSGAARYRATARGKRIAESPKGEELAIEEIV
jgi:small GTP-binding protein